jgi:hypothetical protein
MTKEEAREYHKWYYRLTPEEKAKRKAEKVAKKQKLAEEKAKRKAERHERSLQHIKEYNHKYYLEKLQEKRKLARIEKRKKVWD